MNPEDLLNEGENRPVKGKSPLESLEVDLKFFNDSIREVATEIIQEGLSSYPIFVAHQHEASIGELILDRNELQCQWSIHASTLEEFVERGIIKPILKNRFIENYKDSNSYMCVFVIVPEGANFIFYPYKADQT
jgi:hypothetical protein